MTDRHPDRPTRDTPLEPWALDLLEESDGSSDPKARQETERVVALLRDLESPAADSERADRLMQALAGQTARPNVIHAAFGAARRAFRPPIALALAAGMAGLFAVVVAPERFPFLQPTGEPLGEATTQQIATTEAAQPAREPVRRRATPVIRPRLVNASALAPSSVSAPAARFDRSFYETSYDRGLDRQLNLLMIDPDAFAVRLERIAQRDRFIARLAERAAERGDAPEIALRVRQSRHPLAGQLVDRLLRSNFVASVSPR